MLVTGGDARGRVLPRCSATGTSTGSSRSSTPTRSRRAGSPRRSGSRSASSRGDRVRRDARRQHLRALARPDGRELRRARSAARGSCSRASSEPEHLRHLGVPELDGDARHADRREARRPAERATPSPASTSTTQQVWDVLADAGAVRPRRARDHRREQLVRRAGRRWSTTCSRASGATRASRSTPTTRSTTSSADGAQHVIDGLLRAPAARASRTSAAGSRSSAARARCRSRRGRRTSRFSRQGVIRGLHYHERGQDDLFVCLAGHGARRRPRPRDRRDVHRGHRRREPGRGLRARPARARLRGADRLSSSATTSPRSTTRPIRTSTGSPGTTRASSPLEHDIADPLGSATRRPDHRRRRPARPRAARGVSRGARALDPRDWDVTLPRRPLGDRDLVLHAAAWTDVDGAEERPARRAAVNVDGTRNVAALGAPVVYFSTDYVFDGTKGEPYVESDEPRPLSVYGRTKLARRARGARGLDRPLVVALRLDGHNFVRTMLRLGARAGRGLGRRRPASAARPTSGTLPRRRGGSVDAAARDLARRRRRRVHVGGVRARRSSRRRGSTAACGGSRRRSSAARRRGPRTRCSAASSRTRRGCRTGATACASASIVCG